MKTLVQESGGLGSAYMLKLLRDQGADTVAMFADVKGTGYSHLWSDMPAVEALLHERFGGESRDTYRFLWELSYALDTPIERIEDGRSIWSIFGQVRGFRIQVGGGRFLCKASDILKREAMAQYIEARYQPGEYEMALGMSAMEKHRIAPAVAWWQKRLGWPVRVYSPLIELYEQQHVFIDNVTAIDWLNKLDVALPKAYERGYSHNNCNAQCSQAGQSQWSTLYRVDRDAYLYAAWQESRIQKFFGLDATILKIERGGVVRPISLYEFIPLIEAGEVNEKDSGSCACFTYAPMAEFLAAIPVAV